MKNNETFNHVDEWFVMYGARLTKDESLKISPIQWRIIQNKINEAKSKMDKEEKTGIFGRKLNLSMWD